VLIYEPRGRHLHAGLLIVGVFTDIEMVWREKPYTIKSTRIMGAIAQVEDIITFPEVAAFMQRKTAPMARLCQAYAAMLKYAGARVTPDEIFYLVVDDPARQLVVFKTIAGLLALTLPLTDRAKLEAAFERIGGDGDSDSDDAETPPAAEADPGNP
jgi:hypothetical protein